MSALHRYHRNARAMSGGQWLRDNASHEEGPDECPVCDGVGTIKRSDPENPQWGTWRETCEACQGAKYLDDEGQPATIEQEQTE